MVRNSVSNFKSFWHFVLLQIPTKKFQKNQQQPLGQFSLHSINSISTRPKNAKYHCALFNYKAGFLYSILNIWFLSKSTANWFSTVFIIWGVHKLRRLKSQFLDAIIYCQKSQLLTVRLL